MLRHRYATITGIPNACRFVRNPVPQTGHSLRIGSELYEGHCQVCHGVFGIGDGVPAGDLEIRPSNISYMRSTMTSVEGFAYWAIADGGEPIESPIPAYKDVLKPDEIWSLILFMKNGFRERRQ